MNEEEKEVECKMMLMISRSNYPQLVGRLLLRVAKFGLESGGEELPHGAGTRNFKVKS